MSSKQSLGQRWAACRPSKTLLFWSCAGCALATIIVGFSWGGWVTGGTARSMAENAAAGAHNQLAAAICVDRFKAGNDAAAQLVALKKLDSWSCGSFIEKGGWVTMPGKADLSSEVARLCADRLAQLAQLEQPAAAATVAQ